MILKADKIVSKLTSSEEKDRDDPLIITPSLDLEKLKASGSASIDLRLGTWFSTMRQSRIPILQVDDELAKASKRAGLDENQQKIIGELLPSSKPTTEANLIKSHYISFGNRFILHPRNFVLGVTLEWIRLPNDMAGYVIGRSRWGRRGLIIATAAGVHPGFTGCLTLELTNVGEIPISIKPGMPICQLFLHTVQSGSSQTDKSSYVCARRPSLGKIELDPLAELLSMAGD